MSAERVVQVLACAFALLVSCAVAGAPAPDEAEIRLRAEQSLAAATAHYRSLSADGGYAASYDEATARLGEESSANGAPRIRVEPVGTPTVGECFLRAHAVTGNAMYLDAATAAGQALAWAQNANGGWWKVMKSAGVPADPIEEVPERKEGDSTLDDATTQSALRFLIGLDRVTDAPWLDQAIEAGLEYILQSQGEAGGWPQTYPPAGDFRDYYTFNDGVTNSAIELLLVAHGEYGDGRYLESARRGAGFIVASQLPEPQAAWAQQYDDELQPAPGRSFEPAAASSHPTGENIDTLLRVYEYTADERYLAPISAAVDWLERSMVAPHKWARFYELGTNRPIYPDRSGEVHYQIEGLPDDDRDRYSYVGSYGIQDSMKAYRALVEKGDLKDLGEWRKASKRARIKKAAKSASESVPGVIAALDGWGQWAEDGRVRTLTFVRNCEIILDYLEYQGDLEG